MRLTNLNADLLDGQHGCILFIICNFTGNATITLAAGNGLVTGGDFTTNQQQVTGYSIGTPQHYQYINKRSNADSHAIHFWNYLEQIMNWNGKLLDSGLTISIPQSVATTADVTFNSLNVTDLTVTGTLLTKRCSTSKYRRQYHFIKC